MYVLCLKVVKLPTNSDKEDGQLFKQGLLKITYNKSEPECK